MKFSVSVMVILAIISGWIALAVANDTFSTAKNLGTLSNTLGVTGYSISPSGDVDFLKFYLPCRANVTIETSGVSGGDTIIYLYNSSRIQITKNDDSGVGRYSRISTTLTSGTYYIAVKGYSGHTISSYSLTIRRGGCIGADTRIPLTSNAYAFMQNTARSLSNLGWRVTHWPSSQYPYATVTRNGFYKYILEYKYHSMRFARLMVFVIFNGDNYVSYSRLQNVNRLNDDYNTAKIVVDKDGDVWFENPFVLFQGLNPANLSYFLEWLNDRLHSFVSSHSGEIGIK